MQKSRLGRHRWGLAVSMIVLAAGLLFCALPVAAAEGLSGEALYRHLAQVAVGKVAGNAVPELEQLGPSAARVDACDGFAFPAFDLAIATAGVNGEQGHLCKMRRKL